MGIVSLTNSAANNSRSSKSLVSKEDLVINPFAYSSSNIRLSIEPVVSKPPFLNAEASLLYSPRKATALKNASEFA